MSTSTDEQWESLYYKAANERAGLHAQVSDIKNALANSEKLYGAAYAENNRLREALQNVRDAFIMSRGPEFDWEHWFNHVTAALAAGKGEMR